MNKQQMINSINSIVATGVDYGFKIYVHVLEDNKPMLKKLVVTDALRDSLCESIYQVIQSQYLHDDVGMDSIDNIADNRNVLYWIEQSENYAPFRFLENHENITDTFSTDDQSPVKGFVFKFNLNDSCFFAYQKVYGVNFMSPAKAFFLLKKDNVFDKLEEKILRINHIVDILIIDNVVITKKTGILQSDFGFEDKVRNDARQAIALIEDIGIVAEASKLHTFISKEKLTNAKKFMKIKNSPVMKMKKDVLAKKIKVHKRYSSMFTFDDEDQIIIKSEKDVSQLLLMLNDDYLRSDLTDSEYDSPSKTMLPPTDSVSE